MIEDKAVENRKDSLDTEHAQNMFAVHDSKLIGIVEIQRAQWTQTTIEEQRRTFARDHVHVVGAPPVQVLPDVISLSSESINALSYIVDLDRPLVCQGELIYGDNLERDAVAYSYIFLDHTMVRPIGEGFRYRNRKSSITSFIALVHSNRNADYEGHPQTSTILSFRLIPLNSALVQCPVSLMYVYIQV